MGMVGRYIDALTDEQRDRIIEARDISASPSWGCGCLVETALGLSQCCDVSHVLRLGGQDALDVGMMFPFLCDRFGNARVVRACKLRAAKRNRVVLPEPAKEAANA